MEELSSIANLIKKQKSIAIACHIRPDGDAIGSSIALTLALRKLNIKASAFCDDVIPQKFGFLNAESFFEKRYVDGYDMYIAVDSADMTRIGENNAEFFSRQKNTVNIDHHISNTRFAKYNYVCDKASNSENIFELITLLNVEIDSVIGNYLLMGIMTDTGNFKHKSVTSETMVTASKLLGYGADINNINYNMFTKQSKERAKLFGLTMSFIRYFLDGKLAIATISKNMLTESGALLEDTEGFIDFIMGIDSVRIGVCISEMDNKKYKCSFRSKGPDVNKIAGCFGGGGHVLASGCQIQGEYEECIDKLRYTVSQYIDD